MTEEQEPREPIYYMSDIERLWKQYKNKRVIRVLRGGKWEIIEVDGHGVPAITGTRAESKDVKDIMDFPEFIRQQNG